MRKIYDAYKKNGCPKIVVVNERTGNESFVYDPAEKKNYMEKSDKTGRPLRWVVDVDGIKMSLQDAFGVRSSVKNSEIKVISKMNGDEIYELCSSVDFSLWNSVDDLMSDIRSKANVVDSMLYALYSCSKSSGVFMACADLFFNI